ncbi:hypothetical protein [Streptomyces bullii]|uniref:Secreted protein n=1 Tax=Streptomyces bullii TaxID=349910 RepID=A0ABW0UTJ8_9ACTN
MITAWSPRHTARARVCAGLPRVLALAVLVFGILFAHGPHAEGIEGHLSTGAAAVLADRTETGTAIHDEHMPEPVVVTDGHRDGHGSPHPAEHCLTGQPQQGATGVTPDCAPSVGGPVTSVRSQVGPGLTGAGLRGASAVAMKASVVQQV